MKSRIIILILIFSLFASESVYSNSKPINKNISVKKNKTKVKRKKCSIYIQTKIPFSIEELPQFFPDSVLNTAVSPPSSGRRNGKINKIISCSVDYQLTRRTILTITMTDYGSYENIPTNELRDYITIPKEFGKTSVEFTLPCGEGFYMWHDKSNSGRISFLYCYRFVIQFELLNWDKSFPEFKDFVKFFNLNKLVEESKKKIESENK